MSTRHEHNPTANQAKRNAALATMLAAAEARQRAYESGRIEAMSNGHPDALTFAEKARKFLVVSGGNAIAVATVAVDVLSDSDLSTPGGLVAAAVALLTAYGVYKVPNAR